jgi:MYXO-CTERM domain-containing protein
MSAVDIAQHPMDASKVYAAFSNPTGMSGLIQRGADGTWTDLGVKDTLNPISLRVGVKAGALRIYEIVLKTMTGSAGAAGSGAAGTAAGAGAGAGGAGTAAGGTGAAGTGAAGSGTTDTVTAVYTLRVSDDEAKTWQEYPLPQDTKGGRPRLAAVDPTNVDRVVLVMENDNAPDTVYVSKDGGKTTAKYLDIDAFGGISFAPDGRVWIGDSGLISGVSMTRGMYAAASLDAPATRLPVATYPVQCVGWAADSSTLYACQKFWFGKVDLTTGEFTILMRFSDVSKFVTCQGEDTAAQCKDQLCLDYCGPAHFAVAPVCSDNYNEPSCGKPVADMEPGLNGGSSGTTGAAAGGGAVATGGTSAAGAGGMSVVAGSTAAAGTVAAGAGATTATPPAKSDSGCSCAVPRSSNAGRLGWLAAGLLAAVWMRRRARRQR